MLKYIIELNSNLSMYCCIYLFRSWWGPDPPCCPQLHSMYDVLAVEYIYVNITHAAAD
jgi:hypothetical protein